mmetsp:Transcript_33957/g.93990  ORF Transcript_33957/g.93990 Transcript_33957/m.93990 type:complete len:317 (-) Transcript_33957:19-969(-)
MSGGKKKPTASPKKDCMDTPLPESLRPEAASSWWPTGTADTCSSRPLSAMSALGPSTSAPSSSESSPAPGLIVSGGIAIVSSALLGGQKTPPSPLQSSVTHVLSRVASALMRSDASGLRVSVTSCRMSDSPMVLPPLKLDAGAAPSMARGGEAGSGGSSSTLIEVVRLRGAPAPGPALPLRAEPSGAVPPLLADVGRPEARSSASLPLPAPPASRHGGALTCETAECCEATVRSRSSAEASYTSLTRLLSCVTRGALTLAASSSSWSCRARSSRTLRLRKCCRTSALASSMAYGVGPGRRGAPGPGVRGAAALRLE